ncbi:MAG: MarP family serine protease, partial [Mycobacteriales bacterium]
MSGDVLDLVLLGAVVLFAISGYRQGFIVGVLSFGGFLGGGIVGTLVAPPIADELGSGTGRALIGIAVVLVVASLGQLLGTTLGAALRRRVTIKPVRLFDSAAGAVVSVVSVLIVAWLLGTAIKQSPFRGLARQVRHSSVLQAVDRVLPPAPSLLADFRELLDERGFPEVFADLRPERGAPVAPPDPRLANSAAVQRARPRVVKVVGTARSCSRRSEGSGFVYATQHVMTNAHVVAGVRSPSVITESGDRLDARVVLYDPEVDIAVLYV